MDGVSKISNLPYMYILQILSNPEYCSRVGYVNNPIHVPTTVGRPLVVLEMNKKKGFDANEMRILIRRNEDLYMLTPRVFDSYTCPVKDTSIVKNPYLSMRFTGIKLSLTTCNFCRMFTVL